MKQSTNSFHDEENSRPMHNYSELKTTKMLTQIIAKQVIEYSCQWLIATEPRVRGSNPAKIHHLEL